MVFYYIVMYFKLILLELVILKYNFILVLLIEYVIIYISMIVYICIYLVCYFEIIFNL